MVSQLCRADMTPPCGWGHHNFKHFPIEGMTRQHTRHGPSRYLPGFDEARIRALEIETARRAAMRRQRSVSKTEYLRDLSEIIGWDLGQDATLSFVECAGGDVARTFHGRPMSTENPTAAAF
jgi:hypothetical protein